MKETLAFPKVHRNGTSKDGLLDPIKDALHALRAAERAVALTGPHGRDYYVQEADALEKATAQHTERMLMLHQIITELEEIGEKVVDQ